MVDAASPITIVGVAAVAVGGLVAALKILASRPIHPRMVVKDAKSGDLPAERWDKKFEELATRLETIKQELHDFLLVRNRDISDITETGKKVLKEIAELHIEVTTAIIELKR